MANEKTRVITPVAILSYPHLMEPTKAKNGKMRYQAELVFPAGTDLTAMKQAAQEAAFAKWGRDGVPRGLKSPFDTRGEEFGYGEGSIFVRANSPNAPGCIIGPQKLPSQDAKAFYAGCKVMCELNASAYDIDSTSRGVKFWLNSVWKVADGERLAPERNAADAFKDTEVDPSQFGLDDSTDGAAAAFTDAAPAPADIM